MSASATAIEHLLSPERLLPYRNACAGDLERAVALYEWNVEISATFWATLGQVEVVLRNAMHRRLTVLSNRRHGDPRWYLALGGVLSTEAHTDIANARQRATRNGRAELPGGVVAELTFGFWRYLCASRYDRTLWRDTLHAAFPHHRGPRREVERTLADLHRLRNRIAHHEPVHHQPLIERRTQAHELAAWVAADAAEWIEGRCRVAAVLGTRPPAAPTG